jgi:hypothetical protein
MVFQNGVRRRLMTGLQAKKPQKLLEIPVKKIQNPLKDD